MIQWMIIGVIAILLLAVGVFIFLGLRMALKLFINSLIGFFALWIAQALFLPSLVINIWSILLTAFFGVIGFVLVIILHFLGIF